MPGSPTRQESGPIQILKVVAAPNPDPTSLYVLLAGPADGIRVRAYTQALVRAAEVEVPGTFETGWNQVALPHGWAPDLAQGVYFLKVDPLRGGMLGFSCPPIAVYVLR